jgi:hypothetical protein
MLAQVVKAMPWAGMAASPLEKQAAVFQAMGYKHAPHYRFDFALKT